MEASPTLSSGSAEDDVDPAVLYSDVLRSYSKFLGELNNASSTPGDALQQLEQLDSTAHDLLQQLDAGVEAIVREYGDDVSSPLQELQAAKVGAGAASAALAVAAAERSPLSALPAAKATAAGAARTDDSAEALFVALAAGTSAPPSPAKSAASSTGGGSSPQRAASSSSSSPRTVAEAEQQQVERALQAQSPVMSQEEAARLRRELTRRRKELKRKHAIKMQEMLHEMHKKWRTMSYVPTRKGAAASDRLYQAQTRGRQLSKTLSERESARAAPARTRTKSSPGSPTKSPGGTFRCGPMSPSHGVSQFGARAAADQKRRGRVSTLKSSSLVRPTHNASSGRLNSRATSGGFASRGPVRPRRQQTGQQRAVGGADGPRVRRSTAATAKRAADLLATRRVNSDALLHSMSRTGDSSAYLESRGGANVKRGGAARAGGGRYAPPGRISKQTRGGDDTKPWATTTLTHADVNKSRTGGARRGAGVAQQQRGQRIPPGTPRDLQIAASPYASSIR